MQSCLMSIGNWINRFLIYGLRNLCKSKNKLILIDLNRDSCSDLGVRWTIWDRSEFSKDAACILNGIKAFNVHKFA